MRINASLRNCDMYTVEFIEDSILVDKIKSNLTRPKHDHLGIYAYKHISIYPYENLTPEADIEGMLKLSHLAVNGGT